MKFAPVKVVHVYYKPFDQKVLVGRLLLKSHKIFFEYDSDFIKNGLELSPFKLPLQPGVIESNNPIFDGLFGVFNDSLPDGWGRLLLDRALIKYGISPGSVSTLDRLCFVGSNGMGALIYEPETEKLPMLSHLSLDEIAEEIIEFQRNDNDFYVEDLLNLGGSSAGARPKILMKIENRHWIIKFPSTQDPKDIGAIEYAYNLMAKEAGLDVPKAKLFPSKNGIGFFGCERFDKADDRRFHMHTIAGLLNADHRYPSLDYEMIMKATIQLTNSVDECEKQYRQCVFNVFSHNRDDHSKNFSFLMDHNGVWRMSPSYDLTFSSGPGGEHCSMIMGEGKNPEDSHLLDLAKVGNIDNIKALNIIDDVKSAADKWSEFAKKAGVSDASFNLCEAKLH